jgi:lipoprotein-releasing system ATP-binding protein
MVDPLGTPPPLSSGRDHPLVVCRNVHKGFENNKLRLDVLNDVNMTISTGETVAIVGASGIGKSTLLQIVGFLDPPDSGRLFFNSREVYSLGESELPRLRNKAVGFVFQFHHLLPEFNALENTMMPALINGRNRQAATVAAEALLVRVGLQDRLNHRPSELSGGEQQRVAIARALVLNPALFLADEPTGNLDEATSRRIHELILELNHELAMTLIVATHNMELASRMTRTLTIINKQVKEIETPR